MENILRCPACKAEVTTYKNPLPTADVVAIRDGKILLILRRNPPAGWALPGGFIEYGESAEQAAIRELKEETGVTAKTQHLVGIYSQADRDPRGHVVSVAFLMKTRTATPMAGDDAAAAAFVADWQAKRLAFDHAKIVADAVALMRKR